MTDQITLPKPLAQHLDEGGDFSEVAPHGLADRHYTTMEERGQEADRMRAFARDFLPGGKYEASPDTDFRRRMVASQWWGAECMEDEALACRAEALLAPEARSISADLEATEFRARALSSDLRFVSQVLADVASDLQAGASIGDIGNRLRDLDSVDELVDRTMDAFGEIRSELLKHMEQSRGFVTPV